MNCIFCSFWLIKGGLFTKELKELLAAFTEEPFSDFWTFQLQSVIGNVNFSPDVLKNIENTIIIHVGHVHRESESAWKPHGIGVPLFLMGSRPIVHAEKGGDFFLIKISGA